MVRDEVISKLTTELMYKITVEQEKGGLGVRSLLRQYLHMAFQCAIEVTPPNHLSKAVEQLDMEGKVVKRWESAREAARYLGVQGHSHIMKAAKGEYQTAYGFKWRYYEDHG